MEQAATAPGRVLRDADGVGLEVAGEWDAPVLTEPALLARWSGTWTGAGGVGPAWQYDRDRLGAVVTGTAVPDDGAAYEGLGAAYAVPPEQGEA